MMHHLRLLSLCGLFALPNIALADDELDLADASFDDTYEDFTQERVGSKSRNSRVNRDSVPSADATLSSFDEDPEWDVPEEPDAFIDEDPSWDEEPDMGSVFDIPFVEEDEFVIVQAPASVIIDDEEEQVLRPEADERIENSTPGLDLSIFDIED
jgi:hypothetical protein